MILTGCSTGNNARHTRAVRVGFWTAQNYFKADRGPFWTFLDLNGINPPKTAQNGLFSKIQKLSSPKTGKSSSAIFLTCCPIPQ